MVPSCVEWWCETENRATTSFSYCSSTASLPVQPHCAKSRWIRCQADLNSFPLGELEETTGTPPYYVDEDYPAGPGIIEPLPEQSDWHGSESSTLENDVYVWCYALIEVHARNEWMNDCIVQYIHILSVKSCNIGECGVTCVLVGCYVATLHITHRLPVH